MGYLGVSFTNSDIGREEERNGSSNNPRHYDPSETHYVTTHPSRHSDVPRAKKQGLGCEMSWAPSRLEG